MRFLFPFILLAFLFTNVYSQTFNIKKVKGDNDLVEERSKPVTDSSAIESWYGLANKPLLSPDGQYLAYLINNVPANYRSLIIVSTAGNWQKIVINGIPIGFIDNNKQFVFTSGDSLCFLNLKNKKLNVVKDIKSWKVPNIKKGEWIGWQSKNSNKEVTILNLITGKQFIFNGVSEYIFGDRANTLVLKTVTGNVTSLQWAQLLHGKVTTIWSTELEKNKVINVSNLNIDDAGTQLVFATTTVDSSSMREITTIWYYRNGMVEAVKKATQNFFSIPPELQLDNDCRFSKDGKYIYMYVKRKEAARPNKEFVKVDVWSYRDTILQPSQLRSGGFFPPIEREGYTSVISVDGHRPILLAQRPGEFLKLLPILKGDFAVVGSNMMGDRFWLKEADTNWLVSLQDGSRRLLPVQSQHATFAFSPNGKYLVYYDGVSRNYFSYELTSGKIENLSAKVEASLFSIHLDFRYPRGKPKEKRVVPNAVGIAGWASDNNSLLVYDDYDLWQLDLRNVKKPINLTGGYGRRHELKLRLVTEEQDGVQDLELDKPLLLTAFDMRSKYNGFYSTKPRGNYNPELLTMGPYTYFHSGLNIHCFATGEFVERMVPIKAKNENIWVLKRHTTSEAPNYYLTKDFKNYQKITELQPETKIKWLQAELLSWEQPNGIISQGVLYKPKDFDSTVKYPVIINYYQAFSHRLYEFPEPSWTGDAAINIPWFVSRGYLVFTPDIYYEEGYINRSANTTVVSAGEYLSKLPYVDGKRLGISGHSFGGMETYYIATHSNIFAAIFAGAGTSDLISSGLQLEGGYKKGNVRMQVIESYTKTSLWEDPDLFIEESAIFKADQVISPLLIFHCMSDGAVPFEQAVEMFTALRRLGKKCWMLQYDEGNHGVFGENARDLTTRVTQFFNFYLKGTPPPRWMSNGIRAMNKGVDTGLELDDTGKLP